MGPCLHIYALTTSRDRATILRFLDAYVDRTASEDRGDEELMVAPLGSVYDELSDDAWEWEPARTLTYIVERGLAYPRRAFTVYLSPKEPDTEFVILSFTRDDQLVLGFSLCRENADSSALPLAQELLSNLLKRFDGQLGLIAMEAPPPLSGTEFRAASRARETIDFVERSLGPR